MIDFRMINIILLLFDLVKKLNNKSFGYKHLIITVYNQQSDD